MRKIIPIIATTIAAVVFAAAIFGLGMLHGRLSTEIRTFELEITSEIQKNIIFQAQDDYYRATEQLANCEASLAIYRYYDVEEE